MPAEGQDEALLHVHVQAGAATGAADPGGRYGGGLPWLALLGFAYLTFDSAMSLFPSTAGSAAVAFVVFLYVDLALLLWCLRWDEREEQGSGSRERLKMAILLLTLAFSYNVAAIMPVPVHALVWVMADATVLCCFFFYAFFLYRRKRKRGLLAVLGGIASPAIRLIVDSGASMHAVGERSLLRDLQYYPEPRPVTLPNGTDLNILGKGHIQLEDFRIPNVSLVQGFQKCLISIGQLDTDHGITTCLGRGIARMMLADGTIVGGAILDNEDNIISQLQRIGIGHSQFHATERTLDNIHRGSLAQREEASSVDTEAKGIANKGLLEAHEDNTRIRDISQFSSKDHLS